MANQFQTNKDGMGQLGEILLTSYHLSLGHSVTPMWRYVVESTTRARGPRLYLPDGLMVIAPDMHICVNGRMEWCDSKAKLRSPFNKKYDTHTQGLNLNCYLDYLAVSYAYQQPVYITCVVLSDAEDQQYGGGRGYKGVFRIEVQHLESLLAENTPKRAHSDNTKSIVYKRVGAPMVYVAMREMEYCGDIQSYIATVPVEAWSPAHIEILTTNGYEIRL